MTRKLAWTAIGFGVLGIVAGIAGGPREVGPMIAGAILFCGGLIALVLEHGLSGFRKE